jgi:hypothetical protein
MQVKVVPLKNVIGGSIERIKFPPTKLFVLRYHGSDKFACNCLALDFLFRHSRRETLGLHDRFLESHLLIVRQRQILLLIPPLIFCFPSA